MIDWSRYIGIPYADHGRGEGMDCWGLVRHVLRNERSLELPDYGDAYCSAEDHASVSAAIKSGLLQGWVRSDTPVIGGLVIFNILGAPWHVGLVVAPDRFLHMVARESSAVERLSSKNWARRIEGFYARQ